MITLLSSFRLLILILLFAFPKALVAAENAPIIGFFKAIQDKAVFGKNPAKYQRLVVNDRTGIHEYYVERQPEHVIPKSAIQSVTVKKIEKFTATGERFRETKSNSESKSARRLPNSYGITFKIRLPESKKFSDFTQRNRHGVFETVIGKQSVGPQEFDEPFEIDQFGGLEFEVLMVQFDDRKLEEMLSSFKELVIWK